MKCERCEKRRATVAVWDAPENEGALLFGDEWLGLLLCGPCLRETEAKGPWDGVEPLEEAA